MLCTAVLIVSQATSEKLRRRTLAACKALSNNASHALDQAAKGVECCAGSLEGCSSCSPPLEC